jgi:twitching motility protein PilT
MTIQDLLQNTIDKKASDLHLVAGYKPTLRIDGQLIEVDGSAVLSAEQIVTLLKPLLTDEQAKILESNKELDFSYSFGPGRLRINAYFQKGSMAVAFRLIPLRVRSIDELGLPPICRSFVNLKQGFILVTGPTGHGKSTTIAAIIDEINKQVGGHILTIEDPIEYLYSKEGKALVSQRELGLDTHSWSNALRAALRSVAPVHE